MLKIAAYDRWPLQAAHDIRERGELSPVQGAETIRLCPVTVTVGNRM
jgi:hypothetical protein